MSGLEILAKKLFEEYSRTTIGKICNWEYLNKERKIAWMEEVFLIGDFFIQQMKKNIKMPDKNLRHTTSYSMGYNQGINNERLSNLTFIEQINNQLKKDLEDFKNND